MKNILLIEDDPFLAEIYAAKFRDANFEIEVAADSILGISKRKKI